MVIVHACSACVRTGAGQVILKVDAIELSKEAGGQYEAVRLNKMLLVIVVGGGNASEARTVEAMEACA